MCQQNQIYFMYIGEFPAMFVATKPGIFDKLLGHFPTRYLKPTQDFFQTPNKVVFGSKPNQIIRTVLS